MPTAISINTIPDATAGLTTFFTTDSNSATLTNALLRASTVRRILSDSRLGSSLIPANSIPANRLSTAVQGAQIQNLSINGDAAGAGLTKHIAARSIGPADLSIGVLDWGTNAFGNAVGIGIAANAAVATLNVSGTFRSRDATFVGASNATSEGGQITLLDPTATNGTFGGWEIDNLSKSLRIFRDKLTATEGTIIAVEISSTGGITLNAVTLGSSTPKAAGTSAAPIYRFHDGTNALSNTGLYYANSSVSISNAGSEVARFGDTIRFQKETITSNSLGNRLVSGNVGVYQQNDGTTFTIFSTNANSGLGTTGGTYNNKILTATISTGKVGIGGDPDSNSTDNATLNVTGILRVSSTVLASSLKIGGYTLGAGTITNSIATFTGGATFAGAVTIPPTTGTSDSSTAASKGYVDGLIASANTNIATANTNIATANTNITNLQAAAVIPGGVIVMWSGTVSNIPTGWKLCNGSNGTPDLRNRFVVGAFGGAGTGTTATTGPGFTDAGNLTVGYTPGNIGGSHSHLLTETEIPAHRHVTGISEANRSNGRMAVGPAGNDQATRYSATGRSDNTGGGGRHENRPPYYALCFIMKDYPGGTGGGG